MKYCTEPYHAVVVLAKSFLKSFFVLRLDTSLAQVFSDDFWGNSLSDPESHQSYRPLTVLTFRWNRQLHGMQPAGFHVVNILLHAVVCLLLLGVFRCSGVNHTTSLVATFLFAAHPIHTEAVSVAVAHPGPDINSATQTHSFYPLTTTGGKYCRES